ncbi:3-oxoadipate enol-lactonase/4-carboxymuconolactone decarboxylase [Nocardioides zeae]|uniref:3-oxoadipate enol-lactonase/4-carboxymuconolactone decarboxylase n=1 Tax=Nocardioides zeae TaxID=1457234 RepID=A0ACC6IEV6_9ACTN|nr:4-carboxymuconolactone decarboxylase [Nocardioides zeae]MDR6174889.1 3-oxoadipate enol-lactonase/4-carboxymuconolactone decarboxylase [Nocardioides zeae]MDR6209301.1 3-oxoadipate enol-lactonase/4-carboxymuconolactone decarboxylase [Nocardioides zeae]
MSVPDIRTVDLGGRGPVLLLGPSLGTTATALWETTAVGLTIDHRVLAWDLPGHGASPAPSEPFDLGELAAGVLTALDAALAPEGRSGERVLYAGVSVGGAVGLQLLLDAPERVAAAALLCTGARIGEAAGWHDRAALVRASGTAGVVDGSRRRWFAPGFVDRDPARAGLLLDALAATDAVGYAQTCSALAAFDVRDRLAAISPPVLAVAGAADEATPPADLATIADGVRDGRLLVLDDVAHLAPAEAPGRVAAALVPFLRAHHGTTGAPTDRRGVPSSATVEEQRAAGMTVRRAVLGDAHVDRASAAATGFTEGFQDFITQYAWGGIWTRPGLARHARSLITLTALVARGHHEELAMHVRAAIGNGVTVDELEELFLQTAIYCGVPDANTAFRIAQRTLTEMGIDLG